MSVASESDTLPPARHLNRVRVAIDRRPTITDLVIALALLALALLFQRMVWDLAEPHSIGPVASAALAAAVILPLTWRRRFPLVVLAGMTALLLVYWQLEVPETNFTGNATLLAILSAAAYGGRWRTGVVGVVMVVLVGDMTRRVLIRDLSDFEGDQALLRVLSLVWNTSIFAAAWWFGTVIRGRRERAATLEDRTVQLEREREENARRAVLDERVRIARELHDVVAHHVSVMGVQAGAARRVLAQQPEKAHESSSRQAVVELHRLLGFLRQEGETDELAPQPGISRLGELITEMRDAGLPVRSRIEGEECPLLPSADLPAYRIVQEALTNTLKHAARPVEASVTVHYLGDAVEVEVADDGSGPAPDASAMSGGSGLVGMRERVALLGGSLVAPGRKAGSTCVRGSR